MPSLTTQELILKIVDLYNANEFARAGDLVEAHRSEYPEIRNFLYNMGICLAALQGQKERSLRLLEEALEAGQCWPAETLRKDSDLSIVWNAPEFERLVERSQAMYVELAANSKPALFTVTPPADAPQPYPLLLVLHGRNGSAADTLPHWQELAQSGWLVAAAQSSQVVGTGVYCWDDADRARSELQGLFETLKADFPIDAQRIVLGGFSQGGGMAIRMGLEGSLPARGFIGVAPWIQNLDEVARQMGASVCAQRGYVIAGDKDTSLEVIQTIAAMLDGYGTPYRYDEYPELTHAYPDDFMTVMKGALGFVLS